MIFIHGGRASGKTTLLLKQSADTGIPILTTNYWRIRWYEEYARNLDIKIPKPILWRNMQLGLEPDSKVLIDNGEEILNHILRFNSGVTCEAMVIDSPVMHITNCFLDNPEAFPSEVMGGKYEFMDVEQAYVYMERNRILKEEQCLIPSSFKAES